VCNSRQQKLSKRLPEELFTVNQNVLIIVRRYWMRERERERERERDIKHTYRLFPLFPSRFKP